MKRYTPHSKIKRREITPEEKKARARKMKLIKRATREQTFRTPYWIFKYLIKLYPHYFKGRVLDPAAGDGRYIKALIKHFKHKEYRMLELRNEEKAAWKINGLYDKLGKQNCRIVDFFDYDDPKLFDNAVTNPPFTMSILFIKKMLKHVKKGGHVTILEKHSFDTGEKRSLELDSLPLKEIIVMPFRITFEIDGLKSSELQSATYCHSFFVFKKGYSGPVTRTFYHKPGHLRKRSK